MEQIKQKHNRNGRREGKRREGKKKGKGITRRNDVQEKNKEKKKAREREGTKNYNQLGWARVIIIIILTRSRKCTKLKVGGGGARVTVKVYLYGWAEQGRAGYVYTSNLTRTLRDRISSRSIQALVYEQRKREGGMTYVHTCIYTYKQINIVHNAQRTVHQYIYRSHLRDTLTILGKTYLKYTLKPHKRQKWHN